MASRAATRESSGPSSTIRRCDASRTSVRPGRSPRRRCSPSPTSRRATRTPSRLGARGDRRGRAGRGRRRRRADREHDRGLGLGHARHARVRHRAADPARDRPAGVAEPVRAGRASTLADVRTVVSFPHALAQCRELARARSCPTPSRVASQLDRRRGAARSPKSKRAGPGGDRQRARAPSSTASRCSRPRSRTTPRTRPASCSSGHGIPAPTGHDKTSIVCFQREDRPGSLLAILQEFAARAINLTKLESRPDQAGPRRLLLLHRLRGPHRRRARRRLPAQPRGEAGRGEVPRLVPGRRAGRSRRRARGAAAARRGSDATDVGRRRCARRSADRRPRDRPQAAARRAGVPARHRAQARARRA